MSNDVVMVAIPKELRDKLADFVSGDYAHSDTNLDLWNQLRAAPETVSLEGVETATYIQWRYEKHVRMDESMAKVSDLRRLVIDKKEGQ